jgi:hypothetical protein
MRLVSPILEVAVATSQGMAEVTVIALDAQDDYAKNLSSTNTAIASSEGMFLHLFFNNFFWMKGKNFTSSEKLKRAFKSLKSCNQ